jgi:hypothetical protein
LFVLGLLIVRQVRSSVVLCFLILALGVLVWVAEREASRTFG